MLEYVIKLLINVFALAIPFYFLNTSLAFLFWGYSLIKHWKNIFMFSIGTSICVNVSILIFPMHIHVIVAVLSTFVIFFIVFWRIRLFIRLKLFLFSYLLIMLTDVASGMFALIFITRETLINSIFLKLLFFLPSFIILAILVYLMHTRQWAPGKRIFQYISTLKKKQIFYLLIFMFLQLIAVVIAIGIIYETQKHFLPIASVLFAALILSVITIFIALRVISQTRDDAVQITQEVYIEDINQMFTTIRGQRHDFLNHAQVISSLVKMGKTKELEDYTKELIGEITEMNDYIQIGHPALGALIQSKVITSNEQKIAFRYECNQIEALSLGMKSIDVVKIVGNLIDNAFEEVSILPVEERWVELKCWTENKNLYFTVNNPGTELTDEKKQIIFTAGYSTKDNEKHCGIGLAIVKERVEHYKGTVNVESSLSAGTLFKVEIPIR